MGSLWALAKPSLTPQQGPACAPATVPEPPPHHSCVHSPRPACSRPSGTEQVPNECFPNLHLPLVPSPRGQAMPVPRDAAPETPPHATPRASESRRTGTPDVPRFSVTRKCTRAQNTPGGNFGRKLVIGRRGAGNSPQSHALGSGTGQVGPTSVSHAAAATAQAWTPAQQRRPSRHTPATSLPALPTCSSFPAPGERLLGAPQDLQARRGAQPHGRAGLRHGPRRWLRRLPTGLLRQEVGRVPHEPPGQQCPQTFGRLRHQTPTDRSCALPGPLQGTPDSSSGLVSGSCPSISGGPPGGVGGGGDGRGGGSASADRKHRQAPPSLRAESPTSPPCPVPGRETETQVGDMCPGHPHTQAGAHGGRRLSFLLGL